MRLKSTSLFQKVKDSTETTKGKIEAEERKWNLSIIEDE